MARALLIAVRFHDGRYHGAGDWPPAPARLFQALVAGAARGASLAVADREAFDWLEALHAPVIAAPKSRPVRGYTTYVPNNDLDAVGGDPARVAAIRTAKAIRPRLFDAATPLLYVWRFEGPDDHARHLAGLAERLYQLGRGVDAAWATGEVLDENAAEARLAAHGGVVHRPNARGAGTPLACPSPGSLASLEVRFAKMRRRFSVEGQGRKRRTLFAQPPKPRFRQVAYDSPPARFPYDLRDIGDGSFQPWPIAGAASLVERVRDKAAERLGRALPDKAATIYRVFVGPDATEADKALRLRILPLPSIGSGYADRAIRRILVEIPPDCSVPIDDIDWAFSGLSVSEDVDPETGEIERDVRLVPSVDRSMLRHYGVANPASPSRLWRTVTPAALPQRAARRRIDPRRMRDEAKNGAERSAEELTAAAAVRQALRHARIEAPVEWLRVQREPFAARGARAELFASGTRFAKERLWHVEIAFALPVSGPMVIGDGRYLGLGLMAPAPVAVAVAARKVAAFAIETDRPLAPQDAPDLLRAVRRALMALDRDLHRDGRVSTLFSGHRPDGAPAGDGSHGHVFLAAAVDAVGASLDRLYVIRPDAADRTVALSRRAVVRFVRVVDALGEVRAGRLGVIRLLPVAAGAGRDICAAGRCWISETPYRPTRHARRARDAAAEIAADVVRECARRGLPHPSVGAGRSGVRTQRRKRRRAPSPGLRGRRARADPHRPRQPHGWRPVPAGAAEWSRNPLRASFPSTCRRRRSRATRRSFPRAW